MVEREGVQQGQGWRIKEWAELGKTSKTPSSTYIKLRAILAGDEGGTDILPAWVELIQTHNELGELPLGLTGWEDTAPDRDPSRLPGDPEAARDLWIATDGSTKNGKIGWAAVF